MKQKVDHRVEFNRVVHDRVAETYDAAHNEIFNVTEQSRIASVLQYAMSQISTGSAVPTVLDYGAGTGNLTRHLLNLGANVLAGDVSPKSLEVLKQTLHSNDRLDVAELNGIDLSAFADDSFDMVATYSVLHHVPDYLTAVREFVRVVKPGGVVFIDHECAPRYWGQHTADFTAYRSALSNVQRVPMSEKLIRKVKNVFSVRAWRRLAIRKIWGLNDEGDIHVTADDHIEWNLIEDICSGSGQIVRMDDYLVCREPGAHPELHQRYQEKCADMRLLVSKVA